ncbi:acetaldehyde dehydrogenase (acetylating) [Methylibium sp. Pch-M]|jgi:acetaldehyde/propanal dehydrogenase|uniref:acetaldehyde dehydrogenase (acetylating) n=1 Tax=unclassified Methylibium TaxID=2633235 RepID=UPI0003F4570D|nr:MULTISPECIES: acetaldehyde dehydrogenase (acetylating) [unclassified Methylibium]EWS54718.1 Acetaldehyde dehydrogenase 4 [Methylibium sp. T29]EWS59068.1 Acetaldehyde dehydrogenase 4 [Methylibium sp. T29-B]QAZ39103.1 acetaldehyde dehydrogenase (acetylating) [Methylibium sp. Pch-M]
MATKKIRCALIGSGNIGTDLIYKLKRSAVLEPVWMVGIDAASEGLQRARDLGLKTTAEGVDGLLPHVKADGIQIAFDATSAYVHPENSRKLNALGVLMVDLTPAAVGPLCVPPVNLREHAAKLEMNVNMISCAGQATIPIVHAVARVQPVDYAEIVASLASKSIGPGTRANLDEFTYTTSDALVRVGGARRGKALAIINPAEPPMIMRNTINCLTDDEPQQARIIDSVLSMIEEVQQYVPGYKLVNGPVFDGKRVSVFMQVAGLGDYLPTYAGNLDIMTAAACRTAEMFAEEILAGTLQLTPVKEAA